MNSISVWCTSELLDFAHFFIVYWKAQLLQLHQCTHHMQQMKPNTCNIWINNEVVVAKLKTNSNKQMNATTQHSNYYMTERIHVPRHRCFLNKGLKSPAIFYKHFILVLFLVPTSSSLPPCLLGEKLTLSSSEMCHWWLKTVDQSSESKMCHWWLERKIDVIIRIKECPPHRLLAWKP